MIRQRSRHFGMHIAVQAKYLRTTMDGKVSSRFCYSRTGAVRPACATRRGSSVVFGPRATDGAPA